MVLYPLNASAADHSWRQNSAKVSVSRKHVVPAWDVVESKQKQPATAWWLVAQPDHAALSGDLAASISSPSFPGLDSAVVHAIALHDAGWAQFDGAQLRASGRPSGAVSTSQKESQPNAIAPVKPLSFLEMSPTEFIRAWLDSINCAEQSSPIGGILVSQHFSRLATFRLQNATDSPGDTKDVRNFLLHETKRQQRLTATVGHSDEDIRILVDVLQFCDLLSLYLCCGAQDDVEFPQRFGGQAIRITRQQEICRTDPPIFGDGVSLGVQARRYPCSPQEPCVATIPVLLA